MTTGVFVQHTEDFKDKAGELQHSLMKEERKQSNQDWQAWVDEAVKGSAAKGHAWLKPKGQGGVIFHKYWVRNYMDASGRGRREP